jgi:threonine/homoserine/homoserine lactone efflux protein
MITALLVGMLLGFVLAIPPGPIGMMAVKYSLDKGYRRVLEYSLGTAGLDMVFAIIAAFAASAVSRYLASLSIDNQHLVLAFQFLVVAGLVGFGIAVLKTNKKKVNSKSDEIKIFGRNKTEFIESLQTKGAFAFGLAFAMTNLANPTFLPFLAFLSIQIHKLGIIENTVTMNLIYGVGFGIGNFIWLNLLSRIIIRYKSKLSLSALGMIDKFAGITFLSFAGIILYRVLTVTKWTEIFRFAF